MRTSVVSRSVRQLGRSGAWQPSRRPVAAASKTGGWDLCLHLPDSRTLCSAQLRGGQGSYGKASAAAYATIDLNEGNFWLIFSHAEAAIRKWIPRTLREARVLDLGCGAGKSTRWLKSDLGVAEVDGADVNAEMLEQARKHDDTGNYVLAPRGRCPLPAGAYDMVLSMCVLIEIPTLVMIQAYAQEAQRVLRPGGIVVAVLATEESHDPRNRFVSFRYLPSSGADPHNQGLQSGDRVVCENNCGLQVEDFFWTRGDITAAFEGAGFEVLEVTRTLGSPQDPFEWQDETRVATDYVMVFKRL